jgi:hypothetical protein
MKDVEYVSQLFLLTMVGIEEEDDLDSYYAQFDEVIPDAGQNLGKYLQIKGLIQAIEPLVREIRFKNKADFYSLWSAFCEVQDPNSIDLISTAEDLTAFATEVSAVASADDMSGFSADAIAYSQAVRTGTSKKQNREKRREILIKHIALYDRSQRTAAAL